MFINIPSQYEQEHAHQTTSAGLQEDELQKPPTSYTPLLRGPEERSQAPLQPSSPKLKHSAPTAPLPPFDFFLYPLSSLHPNISIGSYLVLAQQFYSSSAMIDTPDSEKCNNFLKLLPQMFQTYVQALPEFERGDFGELLARLVVSFSEYRDDWRNLAILIRALKMHQLSWKEFLPIFEFYISRLVQNGRLNYSQAFRVLASLVPAESWDSATERYGVDEYLQDCREPFVRQAWEDCLAFLADDGDCHWRYICPPGSKFSRSEKDYEDVVELFVPTVSQALDDQRVVPEKTKWNAVPSTLQKGY
jgi:hypothetical protein